MGNEFVADGRVAVAASSGRPLYLRLADALAGRLAEEGAERLPSAREVAGRLGVNRATVTAAYRELAQRGLLVLRPGRPSRRRAAAAGADAAVSGPPPGGLDLRHRFPHPCRSDPTARHGAAGTGRGAVRL